MDKTIYINDLNDTKQLAETIGKYIKPGFVILLSGDLGAGKTKFTQFLGKSLGVKRAITSPTFNIIKSYKLNDNYLHHMDCYRLEQSDEDLGFDEYFNDLDITIIEWYNFIKEYLPNEFLKINIERIDENQRKFTIVSEGKQYEELVGVL